MIKTVEYVFANGEKLVSQMEDNMLPLGLLQLQETISKGEVIRLDEDETTFLINSNQLAYIRIV